MYASVRGSCRYGAVLPPCRSVFLQHSALFRQSRACGTFLAWRPAADNFYIDLHVFAYPLHRSADLCRRLPFCRDMRRKQTAEKCSAFKAHSQQTQLSAQSCRSSYLKGCRRDFYDTNSIFRLIRI